MSIIQGRVGLSHSTVSLYLTALQREQRVKSMFTPNSIPYQQQPGFQRTYRQGRLSLGLFFPLEAFTGDMPSMLDQVSLAQRAEKLGFSALWFRDVPLRDPSFGDSGQVFDPWVYLGFMAAHTRSIALGTASVILPIRNPYTLPRPQRVSISSVVAVCYSAWLPVTVQ